MKTDHALPKGAASPISAFCFLLSAFLLTCLNSSALAQATVTTDQPDYSPGSTVQITGTGFAPGETVQCQVLNLTDPANLSPNTDPWTVTADTNGNFSATWLVTEDELNSTLQLTATGLTSGFTAQTTFADGIALRGSATTGDVSSGTTMTINAPSGLTAGDVMIVNIQMRGGSDTSYPSLSGWTNIATSSFEGSGAYHRCALLYRVAGSSEPSSYTFTIDTSSTAGAAGAIVAFSGVNTSSPFDVTPGSFTTGSGTSISGVTAITTASANAAVLMFAASFEDLTVTSFAANSVALTSLYGSTALTDGTVGAGWAIKPAAGSTGTGSATLSGSHNWAAILLALKPGVTAGPLDHFAISPSTISSATVGTPLTLTTITAQDATNNTVTSFTSTVTFGGTAGVTGTSGSFVSGVLNSPSVTPTTAGSSLTVTASDGSGHTGSATITTVNKGTPTISTAPTASAITYGQALSASTLSGGAAQNASSQSVPGSFAFTTPTTVPGAVGTPSESVTFTPTSTANYNTASVNVNVQVNALLVQLSGSRTYDGTATANSSILSIGNIVGSDNVTLSGSAVLASRNVGSESITAVSALTRVQNATGSTGGSAASSFGVTVSAPANGNTLVAVISTRGTSANRVSSISQIGATWTQASEAVNSSGETTTIWYAPSVSSAGTTVTINLAASLFASAVVAEYSGILSASPLDQTATSTGNSTTPVTGTTATTTQGAELWIGGIGLPDSSYTLGSIQNSFTTVNNAASSSGTTANNANVYALESIVSATGGAYSGGTILGASGTIAQRGSATTATGTTSTLAISKPTGVVAGDVMIVNIQLRGGSKNIANFSGLSGWTLITKVDFEGSGADHRCASLYRVADSSDSSVSNYTFTIDSQSVDGAGGAIVAFSGVDSSVFDVTPGSYTTGSASSISSVTAITTASANAAVLMLAASFESTSITSFSTTSPGALTSLYNTDSSGSVGAGWGIKATAGSTGTGSATLSQSKNWAAILLALKPGSSSSQWAGTIATFKKASTLALGGTAAANYTLSGLSGSVTISAKALKVSGITAASTTYDGTTTAKLGGAAVFQTAEAPGTGTTSDGNPYTVDSVSPGAVTGTLATRNVGMEAVTTSVAVTGSGNGNYTVTPQAGLTQQVTAKALNYTGISAANKVYNANTTATLSGTASTLTAEAPGTGSTSDGAPYTGDTVSFTTGTLTGAFASQNVGNGVAMTVTGGVTLTAGGQSGDYSVGSPSSALTANITLRTVTYTRDPNTALRIALSDLFSTGKATDGGGTNLSVAGVTSTTGQGATVNYNSSFLLYSPGTGTGNPSSDTVNYTVNPGGGAGAVTVTMAGAQPGAASSSISVSAGVAAVKMFGIPGVAYDVQRSLDLTNWTTLTSAPPLNAAPPFTASTNDGSFSFTDNFSDLGSAPSAAYYRSIQH